MEYEQEENQEGGVMDRLRESPRTVTALIIILIVAAAIYAFGGDDADQDIADISDEAATTMEDSEEGAITSMEDAEDAANTENQADSQEDSEEEGVIAEQPTPAAVSPEDLAAQGEALPEATRTEEGYVESVEQGNGLTHLARKATTRYLNDESAGYEITNEHRIYIEDYIKDHMSQTPLHVGETRTISFSLLEEAVAAAGELNESQLNNLSQYTYALS